MSIQKELGPLSKKQVQIFPTETCNLECSGCPYPNQSKEKKLSLKRSEIDPANWKLITDFLYKEGNRLFCVMGGEPASYDGIDQVISNITCQQDAFVLLSTSGVHLLHQEKLRKSIGQALVQPSGRYFKNGIAISFDSIPVETKVKKSSRDFKATQGLKFILTMQNEFPNQLTYIANVMVNPENLAQVLEIQTYLEQRGIYTNLCTQQGKCFGKSNSIFKPNDFPQLRQIGVEMISRKISQKMVVNSVSYLSQLPKIIGAENYHCWDESEGNPVLDISPDGKVRYCNWTNQGQDETPPGESIQKLIDKSVLWGDFWSRSKMITSDLCGGCSWSRRDRGIIPMVDFNSDILKNTSLPNFDPEDPKLQNIWVQAQMHTTSF